MTARDRIESTFAALEVHFGEIVVASPPEASSLRALEKTIGKMPPGPRAYFSCCNNGVGIPSDPAWLRAHDPGVGRLLDSSKFRSQLRSSP